MCGKKHFLKFVYLPKHRLVTRAFDDNLQITNGVRNFEDIPGPKCYPLIGTLYKYLPFLGTFYFFLFFFATFIDYSILRK